MRRAARIASVTLAVTADQARQLAEARRTGDLDILLLPPAAAGRPAVKVYTR